MNWAHRAVVGLVVSFLVCEPGCNSNDQNGSVSRVLKIASTTSVRDSGLLDQLIPVFEKQNQCRVDLVAVGTGAAIRLAENGDVDALICHAENAEREFMDAGHGIRDESFMHNYFLIVGPAEDPAKIENLDPAEAFKNLAESNASFVSRGDDSGTHKKELAISVLANIDSKWANYFETGQGQSQTLTVADEMNAYTLTDLGTWLKQKSRMRLVPLVENQKQLMNPYSVLVVNPEKNDAINVELANKFANFLVSQRAQQQICDYRVDGQQLFIPDRLKEKTKQ